MNTARQALTNMEYVRRLLEQKQPGFAGSVELAASLVEGELREPGMVPWNVSAAEAHMTGDAAPLAGLRILEICAHAAWPLGGRTLAELGAEVIRIDLAEGGAETGRRRPEPRTRHAVVRPRCEW